MNIIGTTNRVRLPLNEVELSCRGVQWPVGGQNVEFFETGIQNILSPFL